MKNNLPITEELDFAYLLELMRPLKNDPTYAWLPELFSLIGHEKLLLLCKYAGGQTIKLPTLEDLNFAVESMQWFYECEVKGVSLDSMPLRFQSEVMRIREIYDAQLNSKSDNGNGK